MAHFVVAAVERVPIGAFRTGSQPGGKAQYHPRLMLALLVYSYANGIFSSRTQTAPSFHDAVELYRLIATIEAAAETGDRLRVEAPNRALPIAV